MTALRYPFVDPRPPRPSSLQAAFARVEASGIYSNNGPEARRFERDATDALFAGQGTSLAVANATVGLMLAIREAAERVGRPSGYALMPALTFAATAQAALWAGLTPLVCDIDPDDWSACAAAEDALLAEHGAAIAVVVPYATFGNAIDLGRYEAMAARHGVGIVVDAAASLGTLDDNGLGFAAGAPFATVFSMQATKPFAVAEGGLIHAGDTALIERLRAMANFGFTAPRTATLPGLNAKLPEVLAVMASAKLAEIEGVSRHRATLEAAYRDALAPLVLQRVYGRRRALGFMSALLPPGLAPRRDAILAAMAARGIGAASYFSPHLAQQPLLARVARLTPTPVADDIASRIVSLPASDGMTTHDARTIAAALLDCCGMARSAAAVRRDQVVSALVVGGGPAGIAMLTAAAKAGRLKDLATGGLTLVERGHALGAGRLAGYAINSDSTAQTFLTAVQSPHEPALAALASHPSAQAIATHHDALGVPLPVVGPFLDATGDRIATLVEAGGGRVLTGHEALGATQGRDGVWQVRLRRLSDDHDITIRTRALVVATGGHQPLDALVGQEVAGVPLASLGERLLLSDGVLRLGGLAKVADLLSGKRNPRVAVIGGSTSALTTVALLLRSRPGIPFGSGGIQLLHRRPLRPFYPSAEAARAEGFTDFGPDDVCPVSGFVYRLGGFRLEAREHVLRMLGVDGRVPDPRVTTHRIGEDAARARTMLDEADLIVAALGYRPRALPLTDAAGLPFPLAADSGAPMVDDGCRIVDPAGQPIPGLFGIGLAAGFVPSGVLGGERSFRGQANGLWLWQNDVGARIVDAILDPRRAVAAA